MIDLLQTTQGVVTMASVYLLVGLGWNLVYNTSGYLNLAMGQLYIAGAVFSWKLQEAWGVHNVVLLVVATLSGAALIAMLSERFLLRPLADRNVAPLVVTLGLNLILLQLFRWLSPNAVIRPEPMLRGGIEIGGVAIPKQDLVVWGTALVLTTALFLFLSRTDTGRAMRACAVDHRAARQLGLKVETYGTIAFTLSAVLAAAAAFVVAPAQGASVGTGDLVAIKAFMAVSIVGLGRNGGAVFGAFVVAGLEAYLNRYWSTDWAGTAVLAIFLVVLYINARRLSGGFNPPAWLRAARKPAPAKALA